MTHTYKLTAVLEVPVGTNPPHDTDYEPCTTEITYSYTPGAPDHYVRGGSWDQGWDAEVELVSVRIIKCDFRVSIDTIANLADDWLNSQGGYDEACEIAASYGRPDPDEAYERMRDG